MRKGKPRDYGAGPAGGRQVRLPWAALRGRELRLAWAALATVALVAILANVTSLGNGFAYDDRDVVVTNPRVIDPAAAGKIWTSTYWSSRATGGLFRPLTVWTYAMQHRLNGLQPFGYHLVNVLLHALVSLLLFVMAFEYLGLPAAFLAGLLFAVHPVHTEAIANVVGRAELLAALGFLAAWILYPAGGGAGKTGRTGDRADPDEPSFDADAGRPFGAAWRPYAAAAAYLAALLSKENVVFLPAALLVRDAVARRRPHLLTQLLFVVTLIGYLAWRYHVLGGLGNPKETIIYRIDNVIATLPFAAGLWTALSVIGRYLALLLFPARLAADYSYPQIDAAGPASLWAWLGLASVAAIAIHFVREALSLARARRPVAVAAAAAVPARDAGRGPGPRAQAISIGLAILSLTLLPVANLLFPIGTVMAERLLYLPSAGFLIVAAAAIERVYAGLSAPAPRRALFAAASLAILLAAGKSLARCREWRDDATVHAATIQVSPRSARARFNYGVTLHDAGRDDLAIAELTRAVTLDPTYTEAWTNLGGYKLSLGRTAEARADLLKAVAVDSTWWTALTSLGGLEVMDRHPQLARGYLERAVRLAPESADAWFNLGLAQAGLGDTLAAIDSYRRAVAVGTTDPDTYNNLAWFLALTGGHGDEALRSAEKAVALRPDPGTYDTLAEVHFRAGRWNEARAAWSKALNLGAPNAESIRVRLASMPEK